MGKRPLGYLDRPYSRNSPPQPKPFRFKEGKAGAVIGPPSGPAGFSAPVVGDELRMINGQMVQSEDEWIFYKALLFLRVPRHAIQYQVAYQGGRSLGGQILDFVIWLGGAPVVFRIMGGHWHPGEYGSAADVYGFGQLVADGYIVKDIKTNKLQSVPQAVEALKGNKSFLMAQQRKSLADLLIGEDLSSEESKLLAQKLQNLDKVAARGIPAMPGRPIRGSRWYGEYRLYVDWNADGDYSDSYEDLTERFISADIRRGLPGPLAFSAVPGAIEIELENRDRRFSSDYTSSPIYSYINSSDKKRCKMDVYVGGVSYQLFDGWVREVAAQPEEHGRKLATLVVDDLPARLASTPMISNMFEDVSETTLLEEALAPILPSHYGVAHYGGAYYGSSGLTGLTPSYGTALDNFSYAGDLWRESSTSVLDAINDIMKSSIGHWYVSRVGTPTYHNRQYQPTNAGASDWDASDVSKIDAVGLDSNSTASEIILLLRQRIKQDEPVVVWTLREQPTVLPGETRSYTAIFHDPITGQSCGVLDGQKPIIGSDYTPIDSHIQIVVSWRASDALVRVTNTGSTAVTLTSLQLRGTPVTSYEETQVSKGAVSTPRKVLWHNARLLQSISVAQNFVEWLYFLYSDLSDAPRLVTITPNDPTALAEVCQLDVDRKINVVSGEVSFVSWVHHRIGRGYHTASVGVVPAASLDMWELGTSQLGIDATLGV